jgi:hypothetical protein
VGLSNRLPFSEWAFLGCHAEFGPSAALAYSAAARVVQRGGVPFGTGAARRFAGGEGFGWGGGEACASEAVRGVAEASEHLGTAFGDVRREGHEKVISKNKSGGSASKV